MAWTPVRTERRRLAYSGAHGEAVRGPGASGFAGALRDFDASERRGALAGIAALIVLAATPEPATSSMVLVMAGLLLTLLQPWMDKAACADEAPNVALAAPDHRLVPQGDIIAPLPAAVPHGISTAANRRARPQATVADLMAQVSHDIRTPLNAVIGFSDAMNAEMFGPVGHPRYREYVSHICDSGRALLKSAEDTLAIAALLADRKMGEAPQAASLAQVLADALVYLAPGAAERGISLDIRVASDLEIACEPRPLRQAVANIAAEALALAADHGRIDIRARISGELAEIEVLVRETRPGAPMAHAGHALTVAETLLELMQLPLSITAIDRRWRATIVVPCAAQPDFFDLPKLTRPLAAYVC